MNNVANVKTARQLTKNTLALAVRVSSLTVSRLLVVVAIAHWAGVEAVGQYSFVMNYTLVFGILNNFGLELLMMRDIAQQRDRIHQYTDNAITVSIGLGILSVAAMAGTAALLGFSDLIIKAVILSAIAMSFDTMGNLYVAAFSGYERMDLGALAIVIQEFAFLIIGGVVLYLRLPFLWLFVIFILSRFISLLACLQIYWKHWGQPPRLGFDWPIIKTLARKSVPFAITTAFAPIFARVDILMLSYFHGNVEVGYYEVASTLFYRMNVIARTINLALLPLIAREFASGGRTAVNIVRRAMKIQAVLALPITVVCWIAGGPAIIAVYGAAFAPTVIAFQVLAIATYFRFADNALGTSLTAVNREGRRSLATALATVFNVVINLLVLPRFHFVGAAVTSVVSELFLFTLLYLFLRARLSNPIEVNQLFKPLLCSGLLAGTLLLLRPWPLWVGLPVGGVVYAAATVLLRVFSAEEIDMMLKVGKIQDRVPHWLRRLLAPIPLVEPE